MTVASPVRPAKETEWDSRRGRVKVGAVTKGERLTSHLLGQSFPSPAQDRASKLHGKRVSARSLSALQPVPDTDKENLAPGLHRLNVRNNIKGT